MLSKLLASILGKLVPNVKDLQIDLEDLEEAAPDEEEAQEWGWITDLDEDGIGQPLFVPIDIAALAIDVLDQETVEEQEYMNTQQWTWTVDAMAIRYAMAMAIEIGDVEEALFTWVANRTALPEED